MYLRKFHEIALVTRVVMETLKNRRFTFTNMTPAASGTAITFRKCIRISMVQVYIYVMERKPDLEPLGILQVLMGNFSPVAK